MNKVHQLDIEDAATASRVLDIQRRSYRIEADLIGFDGIPNLSETIGDLRRSDLRWDGLSFAGTLVGLIGWRLDDDRTIDIDRLAVDPVHFRRGIARTLVKSVIRPSHRTTVSTGTKNLPAVHLYESLGFTAVGNTQIAPGITTTQFELADTAIMP